MTSAERLCMVAARSEGLLADFVILFLIRWGLKWAGLDYFYFQPFWDQTAPPLAVSDLQYPASAMFYGTMYFVSGLPELVLAAMWVVYAVVALSVFGRTLGMRQAGLKVVDNEGRKPGLIRILVRQLLAPISSVAWIGYWCVGWTAGASALHDLISGTRVVWVERPAQELAVSA